MNIITIHHDSMVTSSRHARLHQDTKGVAMIVALTSYEVMVTSYLARDLDYCSQYSTLHTTKYFDCVLIEFEYVRWSRACDFLFIYFLLLQVN